MTTEHKVTVDSMERLRREQLRQYIFAGNTAEVAVLIPQMSTLDYFTSEGKTPLQLCIDTDNVLMCRVIVKSKKANLEFAPNGQDVVLVRALQNRQGRMAMELIAGGADPRIRSVCELRTPAVFYCCVSHQLQPVLLEMFRRCQETLFDLSASRSTIIHTAAAYGRHDLLLLLCNRFSCTHPLLKMKTVKGVTALMQSGYIGDNKGYDVLRTHIPFYEEDYMGCCSLTYVLMGRKKTMLMELLEQPYIRDDPMFHHCVGNCLYAAIYMRWYEMIAYLAPLMQRMSGWLNLSTHSTILHSLAAHGDIQSYAILQKCLCRSNGGKKDEQLNTPLMIALYFKNYTMLNKLLDDFDVHSSEKNIFGDTAASLSDKLGIPMDPVKLKSYR